MSKETEKFFNQMKGLYGDIDIISVGSSLKLCMVAEGKADAYPRYAPNDGMGYRSGTCYCKICRLYSQTI